MYIYLYIYLFNRFMLFDWYTPRYLRGRIRALKLNKKNRLQQIRELNLVLANPEVG